MDRQLETGLASIRPKVLALARRFFRASGMRDDSEDLVQDVLFKLWSTLRSGADIQNPEAWAVRATKNACISAWRKKGQAASVPLDERIRAVESASGRLEETETAARIEKALGEMSEGTRKLLRLKAAGMSLDEMAAISGRPKGSIKSTLSLARRELIKRMEEV